MFNFLQLLFKPKKVEEPHPLDGPVRAALEKRELPVQSPVTVVDPVPPSFLKTQPEPVAPVIPANPPLPPIEALPTIKQVSVPLDPNTAWPFPKSFNDKVETLPVQVEEKVKKTKNNKNSNVVVNAKPSRLKKKK